MRNRKVISLDEADPNHAELLEYLDGIEGRNRQAQALLQMLMIGARVVLRQESGEEAWYGVRNPDVRSMRKDAKSRLKPIPVQPAAIAAPVHPDEEPKAAVISKEQPLREKIDSPVQSTPPEPREGVIEPAGTYEIVDEDEYVTTNHPYDEEDDEMIDPLQRLQMMKED